MNSDEWFEINGLDIDEVPYFEVNLPFPEMQNNIIRLKEWLNDKTALTATEQEMIYYDLYSDINCCEVESLISSDQANYLRRRYLFPLTYKR